MPSGADAVGGTDQHRYAVAVAQREQPRDPSDVTEHLGPERGPDMALDSIDRLVGRLEAHTRRRIGLAASTGFRLTGLGMTWFRAASSESIVFAQCSPRLQHVLAQLDRHLDGIVPGEARIAEAGTGSTGGGGADRARDQANESAPTYSRISSTVRLAANNSARLPVSIP